MHTQEPTRRAGGLQTELDKLLAPPADVPEATRRQPEQAPAAWAPRAEYDTAAGGFIVSKAWGPAEPEPSEVELLAERGMDPARWRVTSVRYGEWQQSKRLENGDRDTITLHSKRVNIEPRPLGASGTGVDGRDLGELLAAHRGAPAPRTPRIAPGPPGVFVHAGGDYQLGKTDGDGVAGTVQRFMAALDTGAEQLAEHRMRRVWFASISCHVSEAGWMGAEDRFRDVLKQHAPEFEASSNLVRVSQLLFAQQIVLAPSVPRAARLIFHLAVSDLIDLLEDVQSGSGRSATRAARALVEHVINLYTVIYDADASERYMAHLHHGPVLLNELPLEPAVDSKTLKSFRHELRKSYRSAKPRWDQAIAQYGTGFKKSWHQTNLHDRAEQHDLGYLYLYYRLASSVIHGSAAGAVGQILMREGGPATYAAGPVPHLVPTAFVYGTDAYLRVISELEDCYPGEVDATNPGFILSEFYRTQTGPLLSSVKKFSADTLQEQTPELILAVTEAGAARAYLRFDERATDLWFEAVGDAELDLTVDWLQPVIREYFANENHGYTNEAGFVAFHFPFAPRLRLKPSRPPIPGDTMPVVTTIDGATWFRLDDQFDAFGFRTNPDQTGIKSGRIVRPILDVRELVRRLEAHHR